MGKFLTFFKIINLYNDMNITEYDKQNRINSKDFNTNILNFNFEFYASEHLKN